MARPDFPRPYCVLPAECIRAINEEQQYYDKDPERAERQQREREERRLEEEREMYERERYELERHNQEMLEEQGYNQER